MRNSAAATERGRTPCTPATFRADSLSTARAGPARLAPVCVVGSLLVEQGTDPSQPQPPPALRGGREELHPARGSSGGHLLSPQQQHSLRFTAQGKRGKRHEKTFLWELRLTAPV